MEATIQYFGKRFFKQVSEFHRPPKLSCQTSERQNHWSLLQVWASMSRGLPVIVWLQNCVTERDGSAQPGPSYWSSCFIFFYFSGIEQTQREVSMDCPTRFFYCWLHVVLQDWAARIREGTDVQCLCKIMPFPSLFFHGC